MKTVGPWADGFFSPYGHWSLTCRLQGVGIRTRAGMLSSLGSLCSVVWCWDGSGCDRGPLLPAFAFPHIEPLTIFQSGRRLIFRQVTEPFEERRDLLLWCRQLSPHTIRQEDCSDSGEFSTALHKQRTT